VGTDAAAHFKRIFQHLKKSGLLLESDPRLPSVCTLITGAQLKTSWWSHPMAQTIFAVNERLEDHSDVLIVKLVSGKVTFVHRNLWPDIFAVGAARESWQFEDLSSSARALLKLVEAKGSLSTETLALPKSTTSTAVAARELERKLLVYSKQFHTGTGKHAKLLETWAHAARKAGLDFGTVTSADAKTKREELLRKLNKKFGGKGQLPWARNS
jgi:hypothetical protein